MVSWQQGRETSVVTTNCELQPMPKQQLYPPPHKASSSMAFTPPNTSSLHSHFLTTLGKQKGGGRLQIGYCYSTRETLDSGDSNSAGRWSHGLQGTTENMFLQQPPMTPHSLPPSVIQGRSSLCFRFTSQTQKGTAEEMAALAVAPTEEADRGKETDSHNSQGLRCKASISSALTLSLSAASDRREMKF